MRKSEEAVAWVVYKMAVAKKPDGKTPCASRASGTRWKRPTPASRLSSAPGLLTKPKRNSWRGGRPGMPSTPCLGACEWKRRDEERPALGR